MTPTTPTERELLARDIYEATDLRPDDFIVNEAGPVVDEITAHLIAAGWVRWDDAVERCAKVNDDAAREAHEMLEQARKIWHPTNMAAYGWAEGRLDDCAARIRSLTPLRGTER